MSSSLRGSIASGTAFAFPFPTSPLLDLHVEYLSLLSRTCVYKPLRVASSRAGSRVPLSHSFCLCVLALARPQFELPCRRPFLRRAIVAHSVPLLCVCFKLLTNVTVLFANGHSGQYYLFSSHVSRSADHAARAFREGHLPRSEFVHSPSNGFMHR